MEAEDGGPEEDPREDVKVSGVRRGRAAEERRRFCFSFMVLFLGSSWSLFGHLGPRKTPGPEQRVDESLLPVSCRVAVKPGLVFSTVRASDPALWDMLLEPGPGQTQDVVSVVCQRKLALTAKRSVRLGSGGLHWDLDLIHQHF